MYEARDTLRDQDIALKRLHRFSGTALSKFKDEFRQLIANAIVHPNVIKLGELHNDNDEWLYTMERIDGATFVDYVRGHGVRNGPMGEGGSSGLWPTDTFSQPVGSEDVGVDPVTSAPHSVPSALDLSDGAWTRRLRRALHGLVCGIDVIHRHRILHRDLKPANVLVEPAGRAVVLDFGLATHVVDEGTLSSHSLVGTPAYMAPERLSAGLSTEASDWYSVGVMLFEALTGQRPFEGTPVQISAAQLAPRMSPRHLNPQAPRDLCDLCDALLDPDPERRPRASEIKSVVPGDQASSAVSPGAPSVPEENMFVGRIRHLAQLREARARVTTHRRPEAVLIRGESGMGKSALIRRFLDEVRTETPDALILEGRCFEQEFVPFKALDRIIDSLVTHLRSLGPAVKSLLPHDVADLAALFPVLGEVDAVATRQTAVDVHDRQEKQARAVGVFRALMQVLASHQELVLVIDDVQWGDADSARMLRALVRPRHAPALLLIVACRTSDAPTNPIVQSLFGGAESGSTAVVDRRADVASECMDVDALDTGETAQLALALCADDAKASATVVARQSDGCPFVVELMSHAISMGSPATINEAVVFLIERLSPDERTFIELVSTAGHPVEPSTVMRAMGRGQGDADMVAGLKSVRLIRTTGIPSRLRVEPYHDRLREVVAAHLADSVRASHHIALADALARTTDDAENEVNAETIASHYGAAGDLEKQLVWVERAAATAERALAFNRAARLYATAMLLRGENDGSIGGLRRKQANALADAGRGLESAEAYLAAAECADGIERLDLRRRAVDQFLRSGHLERGRPILAQLCRALDVPFPSNPYTAFLLERLGRGRIFFSRLEHRLATTEWAARTPDRRERLRMDLCWSAGYGLCMADGILGSYFASSFLLLALRGGDTVRVAMAAAGELVSSAAAGARGFEKARRLQPAVAALADEAGDIGVRAEVLSMSGVMHWFAGDWKRTSDYCEQALQLFRESSTGLGWDRSTGSIFWLSGLCMRGDWLRLGEQLPRLIEDAEERGDRYGEVGLKLMPYSYVVHLARDQAERASTEIDAAEHRWRCAGEDAFHVQHCDALFGRVDVALYEGQAARALDMMRAGWGKMRKSLLLHFQVTRVFAHALRARSALAACDDHPAGSRSHTELLAAARRDTRRVERERLVWASGWVSLLRAGIAAEQGDKRRALEHLHEANRQLEDAHMPQFRAAAQYWTAVLRDGRPDSELIGGWWASQQIARPDRIAWMLAPGGWNRVVARDTVGG